MKSLVRNKQASESAPGAWEKERTGLNIWIVEEGKEWAPKVESGVQKRKIGRLITQDFPLRAKKIKLHF